MARALPNLNELRDGIMTASELVTEKSDEVETANNALSAASADVNRKRSQALAAIRSACRELGFQFITPDEFSRANQAIERLTNEKDDALESLEVVTGERNAARTSLEEVTEQLRIAEEKLAVFAEAGFSVEEDNSPQNPRNDVDQNRGWFNRITGR